MRKSRVGIHALVCSLVVSLLVAMLSALAAAPAPAASSAQDAEVVTEQPDPASAAAAARTQGHRVEDLSRRTETTRVFANPDGSWSSEQASGPVRAKDESGEWADIDLTLEKVDGGYAPVNALGDLVISDGGDHTFAAMTVDGRDLGWQWPTALPAPTIDGNTATYADVVDGGDLVVTATETGFRHDVVLKQAPADPVTFSIPVVTSGPNVNEDPQGGLSVETKAGDELIAATPAVMYDAQDPATGESEHVAPVDTAVVDSDTGGVVTLDPDEAFLNDPSTRYPVTIDPTWSFDNPDDTWASTANKTAVHPGDTTLFAGTDNLGTTRYRSFVRFNGNSEPWEGQTIISATLSLRNHYSLGTDCVGTAVQVTRITQPWEPGSLNWNNQPTPSYTYAANNSNRYGGSTGCPSTDMVWDVTGMVQEMASWAPNYGFRIAGVNESLNQSYRRFRAAGYGSTKPRLWVSFNAPPNTPGMPTMTNSGGRSCGQWVASGTTMPTFQAVVSDPTPGDTPIGSFLVERYNPAAAGGWEAVAAEHTTPPANSGSTVSVDMPASDAQVGGAFVDGEYRVRARAIDNLGWGSGYSPACVFFLDSQDPLLTMTSSVNWPDWYGDEAGTKVQQEDAWIPNSAQFSLNLHMDPAGSKVGKVEGDPYPNRISDVVKYSLSSDLASINGKEISTPDGASADYRITLGGSEMAGEHWVKVKAVDRADRISEVRTRYFRVQGAVLTAEYDFNEGAGSMLGGTPILDENGQLSQPTPPALTLSSGGTTFVRHDDTDPNHYHLHFDGTGYASALQPVVDSTHAFSVSAWVRANDISGNRTVVGQTRAGAGGFTLGTVNYLGKAYPTFTVMDSAGASRTVYSTQTLDPGKWYVIAGSFDDQTNPRRIKVWVADADISTKPVETKNGAPDLPPTYTPAATTYTILGASPSGGTWINGWIGDIEDIRFYSDEVGPDDVSAHQGTDPVG